MTLDLDAVKARAERYANAIGPGGEKAWLAGVLAADVPALIAEVERLAQVADHGKADLETLGRYREEVQRLTGQLAEAMDLLNRGRRIISSIHARDNGPLGEAAKRWRDRYYAWITPGEAVCSRCGGRDGTHTVRNCVEKARYPHAQCASPFCHHGHVWGDPEHWCPGMWTMAAVAAEAAQLRQMISEGLSSTDTTSGVDRA